MLKMSTQCQLVLPIALDPVAQNIIMRLGAYLHPVVVAMIHQCCWATTTTATAVLVAVIKGQNVSVSNIHTRVVSLCLLYWLVLCQHWCGMFIAWLVGGPFWHGAFVISQI